MTTARNEQIQKTLLYNIGINTLVATAQLATGVVGGSASLVALGLHATGDLLVSGVSYASGRLASKPPDGRHPYGYGRIDNMAAVLVYVSLVIVGYEIISAAVADLRNATTQPLPPLVLVIVPIAVLAIKESFYRYVRDINVDIGSRLLEATSLHQRADAWGAAVVIVAIGTAGGGGLWQVDRVGAVLLGIGICATGIIGLLRSSRELLDVQPDEETMSIIREAVAAVDNVLFLQELRARRSGLDIFVDVTIAVPAGLTIEEAADIASTVKASIRRLMPTVRGISTQTVPATAEAARFFEARRVDERTSGSEDEPLRADEPRSAKVSLSADEPAPADEALRAADGVANETPEKGLAPAALFEEHALQRLVVAGTLLLLFVGFSYRALADLGAPSWTGRFLRLGLVQALVAASTAAVGFVVIERSILSRRMLVRSTTIVMIASMFFVPLASIPRSLRVGSVRWQYGDLLASSLLLTIVIGLAWLFDDHARGKSRRAYALDGMLCALCVGFVDKAVAGKVATVVEIFLGGAGTTLGAAQLQVLLLSAALVAVLVGLGVTVTKAYAAVAKTVVIIALGICVVATSRFVGMVPTMLLLLLPGAMIRGQVSENDAPVYAAALGAVLGVVALRLALHVAIPCGAGAAIVLVAAVLFVHLREIVGREQACPRC